jgi:hypothetical protein
MHVYMETHAATQSQSPAVGLGTAMMMQALPREYVDSNVNIVYPSALLTASQ